MTLFNRIINIILVVLESLLKIFNYIPVLVYNKIYSTVLTK